MPCRSTVLERTIPPQEHMLALLYTLQCVRTAMRPYIMYSNHLVHLSDMQLTLEARNFELLHARVATHHLHIALSAAHRAANSLLKAASPCHLSQSRRSCATRPHGFFNAFLRMRPSPAASRFSFAARRRSSAAFCARASSAHS